MSGSEDGDIEVSKSIVVYTTIPEQNEELRIKRDSFAVNKSKSKSNEKVVNNQRSITPEKTVQA